MVLKQITQFIAPERWGRIKAYECDRCYVNILGGGFMPFFDVICQEEYISFCEHP